MYEHLGIIFLFKSCSFPLLYKPTLFYYCLIKINLDMRLKITAFLDIRYIQKEISRLKKIFSPIAFRIQKSPISFRIELKLLR